MQVYIRTPLLFFWGAVTLLKLECLARTSSRCRNFIRGFCIVKTMQTGVAAPTSDLKSGGRSPGWEQVSRNITLLVSSSDNAAECMGSAVECPHAVPFLVSPWDPASWGRLWGKACYGGDVPQSLLGVPPHPTHHSHLIYFSLVHDQTCYETLYENAIK